MGILINNTLPLSSLIYGDFVGDESAEGVRDGFIKIDNNFILIGQYITENENNISDIQSSLSTIESISNNNTNSINSINSEILNINSEISTKIEGVIGSNYTTSKIMTVTQVEYDNIVTKDQETIYLIVE